jgi:hypothetical protein
MYMSYSAIYKQLHPSYNTYPPTGNQSHPTPRGYCDQIQKPVEDSSSSVPSSGEIDHC